MKTFGLIGFPLGHSFSKSYFAHKFQQAQITNCRYELFPLERIEDFPQLIASNPDLVGLNVTIPYKKAVLPFLTNISLLPPELPACNCIRVSPQALIAYNTDYLGFENSLKPLLKPGLSYRALILGTGGASLAVRYVLNRLQIPFKQVSRSPKEDELGYESANKSVVQEFNLLINTTPLGTFPNITSKPAIDYQGIGNTHILYDLVYNPAITAFMQEGLNRGATVKNGLQMLELQAEAAWEIWNSPSTK